MQSWNISYKIWQGAISYFSSLLEHENKCVHAAAVEALVLIVELKCLKKFSTHEVGQDAKGKLIEEVRSVLVKTNNEYMFKEDGCEDPTIEDYEDNKCDTMSNADFSDDHITSACSSAIWDVLNVSEDSNNAETSVELKFLKRFLGDGFIHHIQATVEFYLPKLRHQKGYKRVYKSPNFVSSKARSQMLKRLRMQSEAKNYQSMCD